LSVEPIIDSRRESETDRFSNLIFGSLDMLGERSKIESEEEFFDNLLWGAGKGL
jgi:hypothetical protein